MKCLVVLGALISWSGVVTAQTEVEPEGPIQFRTPEALGRHVLTSLRHGNYQALRTPSAFSLSEQQIRNLYEALIKQVEDRIKNQELKDADAGRAMIESLRRDLGDAKRLERELKQFRDQEAAFRKSYDTVRAQSKTQNFKWADVRFLKVDASKLTRDEELGIQEGPLTLHFQAGDQMFRLKLSDCANTPTLGWLIGPRTLKLEPIQK